MSEENNINVWVDEDLTNQDNIGYLLKTTRINRNEDLSEVSNNLRIRQVYLEALEENQFKNLPGDIYVIGFIRSYSTYLGLKSEEIIERYRTEVVRDKTKPELKFPSYVAESGIPGAAILLLGLIIAIISYGTWYFFSVKNTATTDQIVDVPKSLESLIDDKPSATNLPKKGEKKPLKTKTVKEDFTKNILETLGNKNEPDNTNTNTNKNNKVDKNYATQSLKSFDSKKIDLKNNKIKPSDKIDSPEISPETEKIKTTEKEGPLQDKPGQENPKLKTDTPPEFESKPSPIISVEPNKKTNPKISSGSKLESNILTNKETKTKPSPIVTLEKEPSTEITTNNLEQNKTPGAESSRIVLEALTDSYIQVRDNKAKRLLVTRLLKKGQRFQVPDKPGLTLITGNAGALKILVDGIVVPNIGPVGAIRRNVMLDATKLKNGSAVIE